MLHAQAAVRTLAGSTTLSRWDWDFDVEHYGSVSSVSSPVLGVTMAVYVKPIDWHRVMRRAVVYDLEFVGNIQTPEQCALWEIGAVHLSTGKRFSRVVQPNLHTIPPPEDGCFHLTQEYLAQHGVPLQQALDLFVEWVAQCAPHSVLISHNGFKSDKPVLEGAFRRCGMPCPPWLFLDSLMILRQQVKLPSYKLQTIHQHYVGKMEESHRALPDALALHCIMTRCGVPLKSLCAYPMHATPLQTLPGVGHACEERLVLQYQIGSVEELVLRIRTQCVAHAFWENKSTEETVRSILQAYGLPDASIDKMTPCIVWRIHYIQDNHTKLK